MTEPTMTGTGGEASTSSHSAQKELKHDGKQLTDKAASAASAKTDLAARKATSAARSTSSALRDAGDKLVQDNDAPNWLGSAFQQAADGIADLAETVDGKEPQEMMRDVNGFARSNPTAFLAGAALAGFAAARFMKAGLRQSDVSLNDIDPTSDTISASGQASRTASAGSSQVPSYSSSAQSSRETPSAIPTSTMTRES